MSTLVTIGRELAPLLGVIVLGAAALWLAERLGKRASVGVPGEGMFRRQLTVAILGIVILLAMVIAAPVNDSIRSNIFTLFGIALTGVIALSSTTLASNAMAGLMLGIVRNFKRGDFIRSSGVFGRVTERGLFHTEIQNEDSDLTTVPNLFLVTNPVTVFRKTGTFISATISLGYDVSHVEVERLLIEAASAAGLEEPFTRILELGDFSITYRVSGRLGDTNTYLGARTALHRCVLDTLHGHGVEIVSPTFMNQRQIPQGRVFVPEVLADDLAASADRATIPDAVVFDKAEMASHAENLRRRIAAIVEDLSKLESELKSATSDDDRRRLTGTLEARKAHRDRLLDRLADIEAAADEEA